jgi:rhodanese-related sulfurtransferase
MTTIELAEKLRDGLAPDAIVLDVRTPSEFQEGHIAVARNIPVDQLFDRVDELMGRKVYCICMSGSRSQMATILLQARGVYAHNVEGGMKSWLIKGFPVRSK